MHFYWMFFALLLLTACTPKAPNGPNLDVILAEKPADNLSSYGLFKGGMPVAQLTEYDLINPLFTDYAAKQRFIYMPKGTAAIYDDSKAFGFPVGTVLAKTFSYAPDMRKPNTGAYKVETRLLIHKQKGWAAYPYIWNEAQNEAVYAPIGGKRDIKTIDIDGNALAFTYAVPNANQCKTCHQSGHEIVPIGPKARNLNHDGQLEDWAASGLLSGLPNLRAVMPYAFDVGTDIEPRARAYLDANCAHCHKADGSASNSGLWLNWAETSPVRIGIKKHPTAAGRGSGAHEYIIEPGRPDKSILSFRMASNEAGIAMPELGRVISHSRGVELIDAWIVAMPERAEKAR